MGSFIQMVAEDNIHTDITTCNIEEPQKKYRLFERSVKDCCRWVAGGRLNMFH